MLLLDGSRGAGGGQILRTALALSLATGRPFRIENIRAGRPKPGLKNQHLACLRAIGALTGSRCEGAEIGSRSLLFVPGPIRARRALVEIGTAGSVTLVLQSLLLPLAMAAGGGEGFRLTLTGGTDVAWSPTADHTGKVLLPLLEGVAAASLTILDRGFYPKGGGRVELDVAASAEGVALPIDLEERGHLVAIGGISHGSRDLAAARVAERQALAAKSDLEFLGAEVEIDTGYSRSLSTGSAITLWACFHRREGGRTAVLGASALGARGKRAEAVGAEAAGKLAGEIESGASVDVHTADQLVPWIGLRGGALRARLITDHTRSGIEVTECFLGSSFSVDEKKGVVRAPDPGTRSRST